MLGVAIREPLSFENTLPSWMQGERYIYCDRFETDYVHPKRTSVWTAIRNFFS